jgi:hypothetical protein
MVLFISVGLMNVVFYPMTDSRAAKMYVLTES